MAMEVCDLAGERCCQPCVVGAFSILFNTTFHQCCCSVCSLEECLWKGLVMKGRNPVVVEIFASPWRRLSFGENREYYAMYSPIFNPPSPLWFDQLRH